MIDIFVHRQIFNQWQNRLPEILHRVGITLLGLCVSFRLIDDRFNSFFGSNHRAKLLVSFLERFKKLLFQSFVAGERFVEGANFAVGQSAFQMGMYIIGSWLGGIVNISPDVAIEIFSFQFFLCHHAAVFQHR